MFCIIAIRPYDWLRRRCRVFRGGSLSNLCRTISFMALGNDLIRAIKSKHQTEYTPVLQRIPLLRSSNRMHRVQADS